MVTTKGYDLLNRLTNVVSVAGATTVASFNYRYSDANQRTAVTNADGTYIVYSYDSLGQVTAGNKYWNDGTPVAGQQFNYAFDDIGNRTSPSFGGDETGANMRTATYGANSLNQYTNRTVPGYVNVMGSASTNATVSIWGSDGSYSATSRKGTYYRGELAVDNTTNALWLTVTNVAVLPNGSNLDIVTNTIGNAFIAQTPERFTFDLDGNQISDGRWTNNWNGENRLIQLVSRTNAPDGSKLRLTFGYDYQGRRITKQVEAWTGSAWVVTLSLKFVYDGWNLIAELNGTNNTAIRSYMWGSDLSGSMQAAGGAGGLIAVNDAVQGVQFATFDRNGNVAALFKAADGTVSAIYEHGPFGELLKSSGAMAKANPIRFSTKYQDDETELLYYGYRYYDPRAGIWKSRDPIGERGGGHLYGFVANDGINDEDDLGLWGTRIRQWVCKKLGIGKDVSSMAGVGLNSALNSSEINVTGALLELVKNDPTVAELNEQIENEVRIRMHSMFLLKSECSHLTFGGSKGLMFGGNTSNDPKWDQLKYTIKHPIGTFDKYSDTWSVGFNALTWLFRHAPVTYGVDGTACDCCGIRCVTYVVSYHVLLRLVQ